MTVLISEVMAQVRDILDEQTASQWTGPNLHRWINEGLLDLARTTRMLRDRAANIPTVSGTAEYTVPENVLEIEHAYYLPGDGNYIPLAARHWEGMDQIWGYNQAQTGGYPYLFTVWGVSPALKIRLFPVPATTGHNISLMIVRYPTLLTPAGSEAVAIDWPEAWVEGVVSFTEFKALRKDRDPRWQEAYSRYVEIRDQLMQAEYLNVAREFVVDPYVGNVPAWIANWDA